MDPAYQIVLSDAELAILGELTVIMGQIDEEMIRTVSGLINADRPTTEAVMGSTKIQNNTDIWSRLIGLRNKDNLDILWAVAHAVSEFTPISEGRNNFIHADFGMEVPVSLPSGTAIVSIGKHYETYRRPDGTRVLMGFQGPVVARRVRTGKKTPIAELQTLRDRAARLSCLIAHIGWAVSPHGQGKLRNSPWHDRLAPTLPPRPDGWEPGKAKEPQAQRRPSRQSPKSPPPRPAKE